MMVAVALAAAIIAYDRHARRMSAIYEEKAFWCGLMRGESPYPTAGAHSPSETVRLIVLTNRRTEYWTQMEAKYRWAARYPWVPVLPDPPPPQ
jgi:hypothetical protein